MRHKYLIIFIIVCTHPVFGHDIDSDVYVIMEKINVIRLHFSNLHITTNQSSEIIKDIKNELLATDELLTTVISNVIDNETDNVHFSYLLMQNVKQIFENINILLNESNYDAHAVIKYSFHSFSSELFYFDLINYFLNFFRVLVNYYPVSDANAWISMQNKNTNFTNIDTCILLCDELYTKIGDIFIHNDNSSDYFKNIDILINIAHNNNENMFFPIFISELLVLNQISNSPLTEDNYISIINKLMSLQGIYGYIKLLNEERRKESEGSSTGRSCRSNDNRASGDYPNMVYYLDVVEDNALDTLIVSNNEANPEIRDIYIVKDGVMDRIISIKPWVNVRGVLSQPPREVIFLQANEGMGGKGLRIVIRNTDTIPDHLIIDLFYGDDGWIVERYYLLNTVIWGPIKLFIESVDIDRPIVDEFGEGLLCDPRFDIEIVHFANTTSRYRME